MKRLRWQNVVISLQMILECPLIVGGRTALDLQGFAHYLSLTGPKEVHLYGDARLPTWVGKLKLDTKLVFHNAKKLFRNESIASRLGQGTNLKTQEHSEHRFPWQRPRAATLGAVELVAHDVVARTRHSGVA